MNPLNIINHMKMEKPSFIKLMSNQTVLKNPNIFRVFEIFLVVAVISRLSIQIQPSISLVLMLCHEYLHTLSLLLLSPPFVFILGNAIVITLFLNFSSYHAERPKSPSHDHWRRRRRRIAGEETIMAAIFAASQDDQIVVKVYRRSRSENRARREKVESGGLRRAKSSMEIVKRSEGYCGNCATGLGACRKSQVGHYPEDHMSNEEFRKTIEDFIAKQQRCLRQEED